ncbi:MAG: ArnT family glycosyltransferase [Burkholderiales bacterium]
MNASKSFIRILAVTLLIKLVLAYFLPMSGDEAYFIVWAKHLDFGYYDHPPMVGWMLYLLRFLGDGELLMRLPAVLFSTFIGVLIYRLLVPYGTERAAWAAGIFLLSPVNILDVLITTDTPLILFVFLSVYALVRALERDSRWWYALAGAGMGLAFLSKYFAVLLGLAYLAFFMFALSGKRRWGNFAIMLAATAPFVAVNVYWNYTHCWDNILFNLYNRNTGARFSWHNVLLYVGTTFYLITPPIIYYWWRQRNAVKAPADMSFRLYACVFALPLLFFLLLSFRKTIGLHWVLAFYPFLYLLLAQRLSVAQLIKTARFMGWFSALHLLVVAALLAAPASLWGHGKLYGGYVLLMHTDDVLTKLQPYAPDFLMATDGYSSSAVLSYHEEKRFSGKEFFVFGAGSRHARQDDMITDYRQMAGRNILTIDKSPPVLQKYTPYFAKVEVRKLVVRGAGLYLTLGYDFNYPAYRAGILAQIRDRYYRIPAFLPHASCYFCDKYFYPASCPR